MLRQGDPRPRGYLALHLYLHTKGQPVQSKILERNTRAYRGVNARGNPTITVRLHDTDILTFLPPVYGMQDFKVNTGGWRTMTTMDRLNKYVPEGVQFDSERGFWVMRMRGWIPADYWPVEDGMNINLHILESGALILNANIDPDMVENRIKSHHEFING